MLSPLSRAALLAALVSVSGGCLASDRGSFLVLGGSHAPQEDLVECVHAAGVEVDDARGDFAEVFRLYQRLTAPQAAELEDLSETFEDALETCQDRAKHLTKRLDAVQRENDELVQDWQAELQQFSGETMRKKSESMLQETHGRSKRVLDALTRVQDRMQPVVLKLQDYALFFHHNLNARAIATLQDTYKDFDAEFRALESEFGKARQEVDAFLEAFTVPVPAEPAR